jgi:hypothetical protein
MTVNRTLRTAAVSLVLVMAAGCAVHGSAFTKNDSVTIFAPRDQQRVTMPLTVAWHATHYTGQYAVFFDEAPVPPGHTLLSLVPADDPCRRQPVCPDDAWLSSHNIVVTAVPSVVVPVLRDLRTTNRSDDRHEVIVVMIDNAGRRVDEAAFRRDFVIERDD